MHQKTGRQSEIDIEKRRTLIDADRVEKKKKSA